MKRMILPCLAVALAGITFLLLRSEDAPIPGTAGREVSPGATGTQVEDDGPVSATDGRVDETAEADVASEKTFAVRGRVQSAGGGPIAGAQIIGPGTARAYTGVSGEFVLTIPTEGEAEITVRHPGHRPGRVRVRAPSEGVLVALDPGLTISGSVTFPDGSPVAGVQVGSFRNFADTGEDGRYVVSGLDEGEVKITCRVADDRRTVLAGSREVNFVAHRHILFIRLVNPSGQAIRKASLSISATREGEEICGSAGVYDADRPERLGLPPGSRVYVTPSAEGYARRETQLDLVDRPRRHDLEIVLRPAPPPGRIALRVTDETGATPATVRVTLNLPGGAIAEEGWYRRKVDLDERGEALLESAPAGALVLEATTSDKHFSWEGYGMLAATAVNVLSGGTARCEVMIATGGRVRVTVRDRAGTIVAPRRLDLLDADGARVFVVFLQPYGNGGWQTRTPRPMPALLGRPVPAGPYRVVVKRDGKVVAGEDVTIRKGQTGEIEIHLPHEEEVDEDSGEDPLGDG